MICCFYCGSRVCYDSRRTQGQVMVGQQCDRILYEFILRRYYFPESILIYNIVSVKSTFERNIMKVHIRCESDRATFVFRDYCIGKHTVIMPGYLCAGGLCPFADDRWAARLGLAANAYTHTRNKHHEK